jgi:hypothetical protein
MTTNSETETGYEDLVGKWCVINDDMHVFVHSVEDDGDGVVLWVEDRDSDQTGYLLASGIRSISA